MLSTLLINNNCKKLKDTRYKAVKSLIETNSISSLRDVFHYVPITVVKDDMSMHYNTLRRRIDSVELLTLKDIVELANLFEIDPALVFKLSYEDYRTKMTLRKKTKK